MAEATRFCELGIPGVPYRGVPLKVLGMLLILPDGTFSKTQNILMPETFWKTTRLYTIFRNHRKDTAQVASCGHRPTVLQGGRGQHMAPWGMPSGHDPTGGFSKDSRRTPLEGKISF